MAFKYSNLNLVPMTQALFLWAAAHLGLQRPDMASDDDSANGDQTSTEGSYTQDAS